MTLHREKLSYYEKYSFLAILLLAYFQSHIAARGTTVAALLRNDIFRPCCHHKHVALVRINVTSVLLATPTLYRNRPHQPLSLSRNAIQRGSRR